MPKEKVNHSPSGAEISIIWSDNHAQIEVEFPVNHLASWLAVVKSVTPERDRATYGTVDLSRQDMQRLIRAGKRARDRVFGADE